MSSDADIIIEDGDDPVGADIFIDDDGPGATSVDFEMPRVPKGTAMLAFVVRNDDPVQPQAGWELLDSEGAGGLFLDVFGHMIDDEDIRGEDEDPAHVLFLSVEGQELQGRLFPLDNTAPAYAVEIVAGLAFAADATPTAPAVLCQQGMNQVIVVFSAAGAIDFGAPAGWSDEDEYTSNAVAERTFFSAVKLAKKSGTIAPGDGTAAPAATGRAWTVVIRTGPPIIPGELADVVPGHIGLIG